jgi:hypothetical protein
MSKKHNIQYTLRGIPQKVDEALRRKARQEGVSLNQAAVEAIAHGLGVPQEKPVYHDLDDLAGTWIEDPAFDEAIREIDSVDPDLWS